ncbi:UbiA family prenyltransferase [Saccharothrix sp.]|uniref:UbiA family prenyltransferase n=1 Tax=Saccharothrix sp. TaxID=1873460 RepID=UPI002811C2B8|nr:UbiA family prenyltransferase [Saccharothrix sp.]
MSPLTGHAAWGWSDLLRCHRLENPLLLQYVCYATWGAGYAALDPRSGPDGSLVLVVVANLLGIVAGNLLNSGADVDTDAAGGDKRHIAHAARRLGRRRLSRWAAVEIAGCLGLAAWAAVSTGKPLLVLIAALLVAGQVAYNLEPLRLKRRGLVGQIALGVQLGALPFLMTHHAAVPEVAGWALVVAAGFAAQAVSRALWWSVPDVGADRVTGIITPAVLRGTSWTVGAAVWANALGAVLVVAGVWAGLGAVPALVAAAVCGLVLVDQVLLRSSGPRLWSMMPTGLRRPGNMVRAVLANVALAAVPLVA